MVPLMKPRAFVSALLVPALLGLAGCGLTNTSGSLTGAPVSTNPNAGKITGSVHGGQPPVAGGHVYLFAVGVTGYSSANTSLLNPSVSGVQSDTTGGYVLSDANGNFGITGDYTCPTTTDTPVYVLVLGGNPGLSSGTNPNLALMASLGSCDVLKANAATTSVSVNEVTTVASVFALAPFATGSGIAFSTSAYNLIGLTTASQTVRNLVDETTGTALAAGPQSIGIMPQSKINSLADSLEGCINSSGGTAGDHTGCGNLFAASTVNGVAPTNTVLATLNIAMHPTQNVETIFDLAPSVSAFAPQLPSAPSDWTMPIVYQGGGIATPQAIAIDMSGNAWVANAKNSIVEISAGIASFISGPGGYTAGGLDGPVSIAVDNSDKIWIANCADTCTGSGAASSLSRYLPSGTTIAAQNFTAGGLNTTYAVAPTPSNTVWAANTFSSSLTLVDNIGVPLSGNGYIASAMLFPTALAVDPGGNGWAISPAQNSLVVFNPSGVIQTASYSGAGLNNPVAIALDHSSNAWIPNLGTDSLSVIAGGSPMTGSPFSGGGLHKPNSIAIDGSGNAWISNGGNVISEFTNSGVAAAASGFLSPSLTYGNGIAVDASGSIWVTDCGSYCTGSGTDVGRVLRFIGLAAPTAVPLAASASNNTLGTKP
jgi:sugar lactone lactonase YvrE